LLRHEYDIIESRNIIDDVTNRRAVCTFLYGPYWTRTPKSLRYLASKLWTDRHTHRHKHIDTSTDNKGRLKFPARQQKPPSCHSLYVYSLFHVGRVLM